VADHTGITWICLEMPDSPVVATTGSELVTVECNSGAARVQIAIAADWLDWPDDRLVAAIFAGLGASGG
jgi:hypothetical protein